MPHEFFTKRRIEFSDTDMAGIVHFSRFFLFMEMVEHEFLRSLGLSVRMKRAGDYVTWPRVAASCDYRSPARFEEVLDVHLTVARIGAKSITYRTVFSLEGRIVAEGEVTAACCLNNPGEPLRAIPIPREFTDQIQAAPPDAQP